MYGQRNLYKSKLLDMALQIQIVSTKVKISFTPKKAVLLVLM